MVQSMEPRQCPIEWLKRLMHWMFWFHDEFIAVVVVQDGDLHVIVPGPVVGKWRQTLVSGKLETFKVSIQSWYSCINFNPIEYETFPWSMIMALSKSLCSTRTTMGVGTNPCWAIWTLHHQIQHTAASIVVDAGIGSSLRYERVIRLGKKTVHIIVISFCGELKRCKRRIRYVMMCFNQFHNIFRYPHQVMFFAMVISANQWFSISQLWYNTAFSCCSVDAFQHQDKPLM